MSSSEAQPPKKRRFWRRFITLLVLLAALYAGGWFYVAGKVEQRVGISLARLAERGVELACGNRAVTGFPLRMAVACDGIDYRDEERRIFFTTGAIDAGVAAYRPLRAEATVQPPFRLQSPDFVPLALDWDALTAQVRIARPLPESIAIAARALSAQTDPDDESDPIKLFDAAMMTARLRPDGKNLVWAGSFGGLAVDPAMLEGRAVPLLAGEGDAVIVNGASMLTDRPRSLRGQAVRIHALTLSSGDGAVTVSGPASVDANGLINADLRITLKNPTAVGALLEKAVPERDDEIRTAFMGLSFMGDDPTIPFKIVKGRATLLGFTLVEFKPFGS